MSKHLFTVTSLNNYVKSLLSNEPTLQNITLKGEVSNLRKYSNGQYYFTLKDDKSRIQAVMFSNAIYSLTFNLEDGQEIIVTGDVSLYAQAGTYQIIVTSAMQSGLGNKLLELEKLKKKLYGEGLFDEQRKKPLPQFPQVIALITGANSAAEKDLIENLTRRNPLIKILVFNALVQGEKAPEDLIRALNQSKTFKPDLLIIGRGGGSIEDLWAFNDEQLVREIAAYPYPVIAAIGHEIDFTLVDYVADARVSTPTGAAELAVIDKVEIQQHLMNREDSIRRSLTLLLQSHIEKLGNYAKRPALINPLLTYEKYEERLINLRSNLSNFYPRYLNEIEQNITVYGDKLPNLLNERLRNYSELLDKLNLGLRSLGPNKVLKRGYAYIQNEHGEVLTSVDQVNISDIVQIRLHDGKIIVSVKGKE